MKISLRRMKGEANDGGGAARGHVLGDDLLAVTGAWLPPLGAHLIRKQYTRTGIGLLIIHAVLVISWLVGFVLPVLSASHETVPAFGALLLIFTLGTETVSAAVAFFYLRRKQRDEWFRPR